MARHMFRYAHVTTCRPLGMKDDKGREIGAIISVGTETVVADPREPDAERDRWREGRADAIALGTKTVYVTVQPARDGRGFGASQNDKRIGPAGPETDAKVQAEIERRIASMTKRYRKQGCA